MFLPPDRPKKKKKKEHDSLWLWGLVPFTFPIQVLLEMSGQAAVDQPGHAVTWLA